MHSTNGETRNAHIRACVIASAMAISTFFVAGCSSGIHVRTAEAPDANAALDRATTFDFLKRGEERGTVASAGLNGSVNNASAGEVAEPNPARVQNPMLENAITMQAMRYDVARDLEARGYHRQPGNADLAVATYISARNRLVVTDYGYGYPFWGWGWRWGPGWGMWPQQEVTQYEQGTLIVDVLDGSGRRLLWRGMAHVHVPHDPNNYPRMVADGVNAIMAHFPGRAG